MKQEGKDILNKATTQNVATEKIVNVGFACDAGLGSSAMGASAFRKKLQKQGIDITVKNYAIERVPDEVQVVVTHESLLERAQSAMPDKKIVTISNFLSDANIDALIEEIVNQYK